MVRILLFVGLGVLVYLWWRRLTATQNAMRPSEARALLGVGEDASAEDIRAAHRRLIAKVHPDAGGSSGLAVRVNAARDALIAELTRR
jgi:preprotein translocase subunit Sec63